MKKILQSVFISISLFLLIIFLVPVKVEAVDNLCCPSGYYDWACFLPFIDLNENKQNLDNKCCNANVFDRNGSNWYKNKISCSQSLTATPTPTISNPLSTSGIHCLKCPDGYTDNFLTCPSIDSNSCCEDAPYWEFWRNKVVPKISCDGTTPTPTPVSGGTLDGQCLKCPDGYTDSIFVCDIGFNGNHPNACCEDVPAWEFWRTPDPNKFADKIACDVPGQVAPSVVPNNTASSIKVNFSVTCGGNNTPVGNNELRLIRYPQTLNAASELINTYHSDGNGQASVDYRLPDNILSSGKSYYYVEFISSADIVPILRELAIIEDGKFTQKTEKEDFHYPNCPSTNQNAPKETFTEAHIYGKSSGEVVFEKVPDRIAVGARALYDRNDNPANPPCVPDNIHLTFAKIQDELGNNITPAMININHERVTGEVETQNVYVNCQSYWVDLAGPGTYELTATFNPTDENIGVYAPSIGGAKIAIKSNGLTAKITRTVTTSTFVNVKKCDPRSNNCQNSHKTSLKNNSKEQRINLASVLDSTKAGNVAGVALEDQNGQVVLTSDSSSTTDNFTFVPSTALEGQGCSSDKIQTVHVDVRKVFKNGTTDSVVSTNAPNCQPLSIPVQESELSQLSHYSGTISYTRDAVSGYDASSSDFIVTVDGTAPVSENPYVKLSSNPDPSVIGPNDNPVIVASTNKVISNPVFEVVVDGQSRNMSVSTSTDNCKDGTGSCQYTLELFQPNGDYKITFKNGDASDTLSFNTAGGQTTGGTCPYSGDTCSYSTADGLCYSGHGPSGFNVGGCVYSCGPIACPGKEETPAPSANITGVGIMDNGTEKPLSLTGGFINLDLGDGAQTAYQLVIHHEGSSDTFRTIIFDSASAGGITPGASCNCTYGSVCDANGRPGIQTCNGTMQNGDCKWDGTGSCAADCSACVASGAPTPTSVAGATGKYSWYCDGATIMEVDPSGNKKINENCGAKGQLCRPKAYDPNLYSSDAECFGANATPIPTTPPTSACNEGEFAHNECFECNTSRRICKRADCSLYICNERQDDGACSNWCPTPTQPPANNGGCPSPGDTCTYSAEDGQCYSGHGPSGFNVGGCVYSCGPVACP